MAGKHLPAMTSLQGMYMKRSLLIVFSALQVTILLCDFVPIIDTIDYRSVIYRANSYHQSSIVFLDNYLLIDSKYALEKYQIDQDNNLSLCSYENYSYNYSGIPMKVYGDVVYQTIVYADFNDFSLQSYIQALEITDDGFHEIQSLEIYDPWEALYDFHLNEDYLFYLMSGTVYATVICRETFEPVNESLLTGGRFSVRDSLLFMQMIQYPDSTYVSIQDLSDVMNPVELSRVYSNDIEWNHYAFHNEYLFILKDTQVIIVDISDPSNPQLTSIIDSFPNLPDTSVFINALVYENYLIIMNNYSMLFVFDFSNVTSPVLVNVYVDDDSLPRIKKPLVYHNDYIYFGRQTKGVSRFHIDSLPEIAISCNCFKNSTIGKGSYNYPYYLFTVSGDMFYFNIYNEEAILQLSDDFFHTHISFTSNDSLLFYINQTIEHDQSLRIYQYDENGVQIRSEQDVSNLPATFRRIYWKDPYILIRNELPESYTVYIINDQNELVESGVISIPDNERTIIMNQGDIGPADYLYTFSHVTGNITIFEFYPPFDVVEQTNLFQFGDYHAPLMFDENYLLFHRYPWHDFSDYVNTSLYYHPSFDQFLEIDNLNISYSQLQNFSNINVFYTAIAPFYQQEFYYFDNTGIHYLGCYHIDDMYVWNVDFIPEAGIFIVLDGEGSLLRSYNISYANTEVEEILNSVPETYLIQNYPNPFNPETTISFYLEKEKRVKLEIFNIRGQRLATLIDDILPEGEHSLVWSPETYRGRNLPSGVYLYRLKAGDYDKTRKMLYLK